MTFPPPHYLKSLMSGTAENGCSLFSLSHSLQLGTFVSCFAGVWTQDFMHLRQVLFHRATTLPHPSQLFLRFSVSPWDCKAFTTYLEFFFFQKWESDEAKYFTRLEAQETKRCLCEEGHGEWSIIPARLLSLTDLCPWVFLTLHIQHWAFVLLMPWAHLKLTVFLSFGIL